MGAVTPETCRVVLQWINICILLHLLDFYSHWITMHGTTSSKFLRSYLQTSVRVTTVLGSKTASHNMWVNAAPLSEIFGCGSEVVGQLVVPKNQSNTMLSHFSVQSRQIIGRGDETREVGSVPRDPKGNVLKSKRIELPPPPSPTHLMLLHHFILTGCYTGSRVKGRYTRISSI